MRPPSKRVAKRQACLDAAFQLQNGLDAGRYEDAPWLEAPIRELIEELFRRSGGEESKAAEWVSNELDRFRV